MSDILPERCIHDITVSKIGQWTYLTYITVAVSAAK